MRLDLRKDAESVGKKTFSSYSAFFLKRMRIAHTGSENLRHGVAEVAFSGCRSFYIGRAKRHSQARIWTSPTFFTSKSISKFSAP